MIFSDIKKLVIPQGEVKEIKKDGVLLWKKPIENLIDTATLEPNGTEIYYEKGYRDGYRWSNSSNTEVEYNDYNNGNVARITGWIPFTLGKNYNIQYFNASVSSYVSGIYVVYYMKDGTINTQGIHNSNLIQGLYHGSYDTENDIVSLLIGTTAEHLLIDATHFKISGMRNTIGEPVITCTNYANKLLVSTDETGTKIYNNGLGYKENTRIATATYGEREMSGIDCTGYIACKKGDTFYLKNITMPTGNNYIGVAFYNNYTYEDASFIRYLDASQMNGLNGKYDSSDNLIQFTIIDENCKYIRLTGSNIDSNSIITINEEID